MFSFLNWTESLFLFIPALLKIGNLTSRNSRQMLYQCSFHRSCATIFFFFFILKASPLTERKSSLGRRPGLLRQVQISLHGLIILELLDENNAHSIASNFSMVSLHSLLLSSILVSTQKLELSLSNVMSHHSPT